MENKYLKFDIDSAEIIDEDVNSQFATARILAFSSDVNRHDLFCSEDVLRETAPTIYDKPILYSIDENLNDFYTHVSPGKSLICGFVVSNSAEFIRLPDSRLGLVVLAKLWKRYAPKVMEIFKGDKKANRKVSVEMEVYALGEKKPNGIIDMLSFGYAGICLLGEFVTEASQGANMQMLSFSEEEKLYNQDVIKEFGKLPNSRYSEIDLAIPLTIKKKAKKALEQHKLTGGQTASVLAASRHLVNSDKISPEKARFIKKHLSKKDDEMKYNLLGGKESFVWASDLCQQLDKCDSETVSYFAEDEEKKNGEKESLFVASELIEKSKTENMSEDDLKSNIEKKEEIIMGDELEKVEEKEELPTEKMAEKPEPKESVKEEKVESPAEEEKETPEQEKAESPAEEKAEKKAGTEKKFAFPAKMSVEKMSEMFASDMEDEDVKMACGELEKMAKGEECDFGAVMSGMYAKMCKMSAACEKMAKDSEVYMAELDTLKKFKANIEGQQKEFAVAQTLKEIGERVVVPEDVMSEMKESAANFSIDNIDAWKNSCKARVFDFAVKKVDGKNEDKPIVVGLWQTVEDAGKGKKDSVWNRLG